MRKRIVLYVIILQLVIIFSLIFSLSKKDAGVLGTVSVNPIYKDNLIFTPSSDLKYFYEPEPNKVYYLTDDGDVITINGDSLNEVRDYEIQKGDGVYRIVVLGDSWTYGLNVPTDKNWTEDLEKMLNDNCRVQFEVINLGVHGYDTRYSVERFEKRGLKYAPDLVIWHFVDLKRVLEEMNPLGLKTKNDYRVVKQRMIASFGLENVYSYQIGAFSRFNSIYAGKLLVVPQAELFTDDELDILKSFTSNRAGGYYHEIDVKLMEDEDLIMEDLHPNEKGHEMIAKDVLGSLLKEGIAPCD